MSTDRAELPGEDAERGWRERIGEVAAAAQSLLATRVAIFQEEAAAKAELAARGIAAVLAAAALAIGALLLFAALLAAVFARLFGSVVFGILAAVVLYAGGAAAAAWFAWKSLSRVRPLEFPALAAELSRDWDAVAASLSDEVEAGGGGGEPDSAGEAEVVEDLEERFRAGSE